MTRRTCSVFLTGQGVLVRACVWFQVWDARSHQLLQHYPAHDDDVTSISFHESGNFLVSSSVDASVKVKVTFIAHVCRLTVQFGRTSTKRLISLLFFSPHFSSAFPPYLFTPPPSLKIWDLREGRLMYTLKGHSGPVTACVFSPDGTRFASGGRDGVVMSWRSHLASSFADGETSAGAGAALKRGARPRGSLVGAGGKKGYRGIEGADSVVERRKRSALGTKTTNPW